MQDAARARISPTLNLSETSLLGQLFFQAATQLRQLWEAAQAIYASRDPSQAVDDALDTIGELRGVPRNPARASTAEMTITLAAGTYLAGSLVVNKINDATVRFSNDADITTAGATLVGVPFTATTTGPLDAPAGTLTVIANPVAGFSAPTNPAAAVIGADRETNAAYRLRQEAELQLVGSSSTNAIRADLLQVPGVTYVGVLENDTDVTDANGLPPHSVEALVLGGTDVAVAEAVYAAKAAGIRAYGTDSEVVTDSSGNDHTIGFSRPVSVGVKFSGSFDYLETAWIDEDAAETAVKDAILAAFTEHQGVGRDVIHARYVAAVMSVPGAINIALGQAKLPDSVTENDIVIGPRELATLSASDITISAIPQAAPP